MNLTIDLEIEEDGRWIAEALELPGVMCYGQSREEAIANAERLAIEVIADRIAHSELPSSAFAVSFTIPDEPVSGSDTNSTFLVFRCSSFSSNANEL